MHDDKGYGEWLVTGACRGVMSRRLFIEFEVMSRENNIAESGVTDDNE